MARRGARLMLAYVFWHAPRSPVDPAAYAAALDAFHLALADAPPAGFVRSFSTRTSRLPWLDADAAYEDWYLVSDSAALDPLDAAAVDVRRRAAHDVAAGAARIGTGGLYRLVAGEPFVPLETFWFSKPEGVTYAAFTDVLATIPRDGAALWQRQMTLGPAPEFAAHTRSAVPGVAGLRVTHG